MSLYEGKIEEFLDEALECGRKYLPQADYLILRKKVNFLKIRFRIKAELFMDIYYNSYKERKDYVLVYQGKRIFGYDNCFGWHYHSLGNPEQHIPCEEPSLEKAFKKVRELVFKKGVK